MSLAERFKASRVQAGLTQVQLADVIGVHQSVISDLERGVTIDPGSGMLLRASELLKADPKYLMFGSDEVKQLSTSSPVALASEELEDCEAILRVYLRLSISHKRVLLSMARALREAERDDQSRREQKSDGAA